LRGKTGKYPGKTLVYLVNTGLGIYRVFTIVGIYLVFTWKIWPKVKLVNTQGIYLWVFTSRFLL